MKAILKNYRQAPRKVRLVADLIKGKNLDQAKVELSFLPKRAAKIFGKLLNSAEANAKQNFSLDQHLFIKDLRVDKGIVLKRFMPRARGSASPIRKRTSHITLILGERGSKKK